MLGRSFILLALSLSASVLGKPIPGNADYLGTDKRSPVPANADYVGADKRAALDFGVSLNLDLGSTRMIDLDQARANYKLSLINGETHHTSKRGDSDVKVTNVGVLYTASVGLGTPPTQYNLLIDTGSSNTWVGAGQAYQKTSSSVNTGKNVSVGYGSGGFEGVEYLDTLTLSNALTVTNQSIGVANHSSGFSGYDGILGLAPVGLTANTVQDTDTVPTVSNNLASQGKITSEVMGISFNPTTTEPNSNGVMTFGGPGEGLFTDEIEYVGISSENPASKFWGIDLGLTYGSSNQPILNQASGIIDTGTTLVLLATDAYNAYVNATGATYNQTLGLLTIPSDKHDALQSLFFTVGSKTFEFTPNAQTFPRALNTFVGADANAIYLCVGNMGSVSGNGLDFILGYSFLERFYSVYDTAQKRVGLATTSNTYATTN